MKMEEIKNLLDKYYAGESSLEEEDQLLRWFRSNEVTEEFESERAQFLYFHRQKQQEASDMFSQKLMSGMEGKSVSLLSAAWLKIAASIILVAVLGYTLYNFVGPKEQVWQRIATREGEKKEVTLSDGSKVWLNALSELQFPTQFDKKREVTLTGEAFFEIARDAKRPFSIISQNTTTEVLGTSFNVRSYIDESQIEVVVVTGKVAFTASDDVSEESVMLETGLKATLIKEDQLIVKEENDDLNFLSWKTNQLIFNNQELNEVLVSVGRHYNVGFIYDNDELGKCPFTGSFKDLKKQEVITTLSTSLEIEFELQEDTYFISGRGCL